MDSSSTGEWFNKQKEEILRKQYPLHCSVRDGNLEEMLSLLKTGRHDLYEEDDLYGWTPTHWAAYFGKLTCLRHLLENGGSCDNATHRVNQTPAHTAALAGNSHCLLWLLERGASLNRQDYLGETPIHKAARVGSMECVSLLVSQGASLSIKNHNCQLPSMVAAASGFQECSNYIEKAMQLQQQNHTHMKTSPAENNNTQMPSLHEIHNGLANGHCYSNGHSEMDDMETEMELTDSCSGSIEREADSGISCSMTNGHDNQEPLGMYNGFSAVGVKRGRDDCEDECFKRRRVHDRQHLCQDESTNNNNVLSSYNAILAISVNPLPHSPPDSKTPIPGKLSTIVEAAVENADFRMFSSMVSHHIPLYKPNNSSDSNPQHNDIANNLYQEVPAKCTLLTSHMI